MDASDMTKVVTPIVEAGVAVKAAEIMLPHKRASVRRVRKPITPAEMQAFQTARVKEINNLRRQISELPAHKNDTAFRESVIRQMNESKYLSLAEKKKGLRAIAKASQRDSFPLQEMSPDEIKRHNSTAKLQKAMSGQAKQAPKPFGVAVVPPQANTPFQYADNDLKYWQKVKEIKQGKIPADAPQGTTIEELSKYYPVKLDMAHIDQKIKEAKSHIKARLAANAQRFLAKSGHVAMPKLHAGQSASVHVPITPKMVAPHRTRRGQGMTRRSDR